MRSFYATTCKTDCLQILDKFCKNWISITNIVHQLKLSLRCNHWKIQNSGDFQDAINSIRHSANAKSEANDVSLLWRHSFWVRSRTLEHAYKGHFWRFWGNLPKMLSAIVWTPKRHFVTSQRVFWTIVHEIPCTDYFSRRVRGKNKNKNERPYISRISPGAPLRPIGTNFGLRVRLVDVINSAKFYRKRLRDVDSVRGRIWPSPLNCDVAVNTVWTTVHSVIYQPTLF